VKPLKRRKLRGQDNASSSSQPRKGRKEGIVSQDGEEDTEDEEGGDEDVSRGGSSRGKGTRPPKSTVAGKKRKMSTSLEEGVAQRMTELVQRVEHLEKENKKLLKRMKVME